MACKHVDHLSEIREWQGKATAREIRAQEAEADRDRLASLLEKLQQGIEQAHAAGCCCQIKGHEADCHIPILADLLTEMGP